MIAPAQSTSMNRQAVPSIFLSVSIVCFFAVALYQRDPESGRSAKVSDSRHSARRRGTTSPARAGVATADPGTVPAQERTATHPTPTAPTTSRLAATTAPIRPNERGRATRTDGLNPVRVPIGDGAARATDLEAPLPAIRVVSKREGPDRRSPPPSPPVSPAAARASGVKLARAPFTIAGAGETITDVARRVYGTAGDADMLWRANRDVVGDPGVPLSPGTVLRTPARSGR
jgi:hypothetical protein